MAPARASVCTRYSSDSLRRVSYVLYATARGCGSGTSVAAAARGSRCEKRCCEYTTSTAAPSSSWMRRTTRAPCTQRRAAAQREAQREQQGTSEETRGSSESLSSSVVSPRASSPRARADASPGGHDQRAGASGEGDRLGVGAASSATLTSRRRSDHPAWRGLAAPSRAATRGDARRARDAAGAHAGGEAGRLQASAAETRSAMGRQRAAGAAGFGGGAALRAGRPRLRGRASGADALGGRPRKEKWHWRIAILRARREQSGES